MFFFLFAVFLSAAEVPLSHKVSQDIEITPAMVSSENKTITTDELTTLTSTLAPLNVSENASIEGSGDETLPPLVFPADEGKLLPGNETLLKILQNSSSQGMKSSEVIDFTRNFRVEFLRVHLARKCDNKRRKTSSHAVN